MWVPFHTRFRKAPSLPLRRFHRERPPCPHPRPSGCSPPGRGLAWQFLLLPWAGQPRSTRDGDEVTAVFSHQVLGQFGGRRPRERVCFTLSWGLFFLVQFWLHVRCVQGGRARCLHIRAALILTEAPCSPWLRCPRGAPGARGTVSPLKDAAARGTHTSARARASLRVSHSGAPGARAEGAYTRTSPNSPTGATVPGAAVSAA